MLNDFRYASRMLLKSRAFVFGAVAALALGIGATTAMFSAVNSVLLRPLPFPDADRLYVVRETRAQAGFERTVVADGEYLQWGRNNPHFQYAAVADEPGLSIRIGATPERLPALRVPADFFPLFGVTPAAGRAFTREAEQPGHGNVILISYNLWQQRLGASPEVFGRPIAVEGRPFTLIGILPKRFSFGGRVDAIVPMTLGPTEAAEFSSHAFDMYARLAPGVDPAQAAADLTRVILATQGDPPHATGAVLVPLQEEAVGDSRTAMLVLFSRRWRSCCSSRAPTSPISCSHAVRHVRRRSPSDSRSAQLARAFCDSSSPKASCCRQQAGCDPSVASAIRDVIHRLDRDLPVDSIEPMIEIVRASLSDRELEFAILAAFALIAVVLAATGIYGVMTYTITQRAQEFGIRLALRASPKNIVQLVSAEGLRLTAAGTLVGLAGAWAGSQMLDELLFGIGPGNPIILASAAALLAFTALAACVVPSLRAVRVDPLTYLRSQ